MDRTGFHHGYNHHYIERWEPTYNNPYSFTVKVTTGDGCSYLSAPFKVNVYDKPYTNITGSASEVCAGEEVTLRANLNNYNDPMITFQWYENQVNNSHSLSGRTHEVETFAPTNTTNYIVEVTHLMDYDPTCIAYDTFRVEVAECIPSDGESNCCSVLNDAVDSLQEMINSSLRALQDKIDSMQQVIDSLGLIVDTSITHLGFYCGTSTVTDYDGNVYNTVKIGDQCWMRENLRTTHYADGTAVPAGGGNKSDTDPYYYDYSSSGMALAQRGYLYNWPAAKRGASSSSANPSGVQGICPAGWHLPSDAEWTTLTDYVSSQSEFQCGGNSNYITKALASTEGWNSYSSNCVVGNDPSSNNATGFSAVPAGGCLGSTFYYAGDLAYFWSSSQYDGSLAYDRYLGYSNADVGRHDRSKDYGHSVRCLRD
jgi:uncharacterized protein (TIGR02145 family)